MNKSVKLKDVIKTIGLAPICKKSREGSMKVVKPSFVVNGEIQVDMLERCEVSTTKDISRFYLRKDDILFQAKGNKFGAVLVKENMEKTIANQIYFTLKGDESKILPEFLCWLLNSSDASAYFDRSSSGSVIKAVNKNVLLDYSFGLPELSQQKDLIALAQKFEEEKQLTTAYLQNKEQLVEAKILKTVRGL